jgi:hypothetical protein
VEKSTPFFTPEIWLKRGFSTASTIPIPAGQDQIEVCMPDSDHQ